MSQYNNSGFFNLPPELRTYIYDLAFTTNEEVDGVGTPLLFAGGPRKSLLLTCRRIRNEASGLYESGFRRYWRQSTFILDCRGDAQRQRGEAAVLGGREQDLAEIKTVVVFKQSGNGDVLYRATYSSDADCWSVDCYHGVPMLEPVSKRDLRLYYDEMRRGVFCYLSGAILMDQGCRRATTKQQLLELINA